MTEGEGGGEEKRRRELQKEVGKRETEKEIKRERG